MTKFTQQILAFTWYHERDYVRLREVDSDLEGLEDDYQSWLVAARRALVHYKQLGFEPQRVYIDIDEYFDWCEQRERAVSQHSHELFKEIKRQEFYRSLEKFEHEQAALRLKDKN